MAETDDHHRTGTMVEHKEDHRMELQPQTSAGSASYTAPRTKERKGTAESNITMISHSAAPQGIYTSSPVSAVTTNRLTSQYSAASASNQSLQSHGASSPNVGVIPEHQEMLVQQINAIAAFQGSNNAQAMGSRANANGKNAASIFSDAYNELSDDNIDEQLYSYNWRPMTFVIFSICIIYIPDMVLASNDDTLWYIQLIYLLFNIALFMILIPLYAKCVPETTDSIINNAGKSLNRQPPPALLRGSNIHLHAASHSNQETNGNDRHQNMDSDEVDQAEHMDSMMAETSTCSSIWYSFDAMYNRVFNIRNIAYDVGANVVNFDSRIYNNVNIQFAGGFLILSNILLLLCLLASHGYTEQDIHCMRGQSAFLVFSCQMIVAVTLSINISVHFTQLKDEMRKAIGNDIYVERLESNIQTLTQYHIFSSVKPFGQYCFYFVSVALSVALWLLQYHAYDASVYEPEFSKNLMLFILILFSVIFIHLVFRLIVMYSYSVIMVKQFCHPIQVKTMHQVITYWRLRCYYCDIVLYAFVSLFNRILSFLFTGIAIILVYIYLMLDTDVFIDIVADHGGPMYYLPVYVLTVYVMFACLYALHLTANTYTLQAKHVKMINAEAVFFKHFLYHNQYNNEMKAAMHADEILTIMDDIKSNIQNFIEFQICGIAVNSTSEVIVRMCYIVFSLVILARFI